ncbi:hypothetical protein BH24BAC1_BH24BAC1_31560 [soil metagenome]
MSAYDLLCQRENLRETIERMVDSLQEPLGLNTIVLDVGVYESVPGTQKLFLTHFVLEAWVTEINPQEETSVLTYRQFGMAEKAIAGKS